MGGVNIEMVARCVGCKHEMKWTPPPNHATNELPTCPKCYSPMVVESVTAHLATLQQNTDTSNVLADIAAERVRQVAKWGHQAHSGERWVSIITEELGEAAEAVNDAAYAGFDAGESRLTHKEWATALITRVREEVIQVAAVATAWAEALDREAAEL